MTRTRPTSHAFTLIEMIVVMVVLAVLGAMIVPRFSSNEERNFKLAVEQVSDLLMMYAQRENLGQKPVGLLHDRHRNRLLLMTLDTEDTAEGQGAEWREDPFVRPVQLPPFILEPDVEIYADGDLIDASDIPLSNELGQQRPTIRIAVRSAGRSAALTLYPYGVAPELTSDYLNTFTARTPEDLDAGGRSREDW
jgi:prepilin-type N-terminal cleavage/methylation domain-containing protein